MTQDNQDQLINSIEKFSGNNFKAFLIKAFNTITPNTKFINNWHIDFIARYLEAVEDTKVRRLIINIPPRSLKSTIISVAWPAWILGKNPRKRIIVASYSQTLSLKHSQECRLIINSDWYREMFPHTKIRKGSDAKNKFLTTKQGFRFATSIEGTLTGEGADILIVDDPHTPLQAASDVERERAIVWFDQTFSTRLNDKKNGAILLVMQRLHRKDLSGHLLKKNGWHHIKLEAVSTRDQIYEYDDFEYHRLEGELLCGAREGEHEITTAKSDLGSYAFAAQYQQDPVMLDSNIIKYSWLMRHDYQPSDFQLIYQSWDCASKLSNNSDYSVCTTWGVKDNQFYLLDVFKERLEFYDLKKVSKALAEKYDVAAIIIEDKMAGQSLVQELLKDTMHAIIPINPTKDKMSRLIAVSSLFEAGKVLLPTNALWLNAFESELIHFPNVDHDDQVDSVTQFLSWIRTKGESKSSLRVL